MANRNSAGFGFIPAGTLGNTPATNGLSEYFIVAGDTANKFNGMGVRVTAGYIVTGEDSNTGTTCGVLQGIFYNAATTLKPTFKNYYPGSITPPSSGAIEAFVYDSPYQMFEVQSAATGASDQADIFKCCDLASNGGSTANGVSSLESADTFSAQATFKVLGVSRDPKNNEIGSANVNWRVMIDEHLLGSGTAGAG